MPLIITAIDLKLSPSTSEMETRRRRMEAMGKLHSACGQAYEIADYMGSNTNQLLRLAYDFTRRLFLRDTTGPGGAGLSENQNRHGSSRTNNWGDAFLRFPRAYLMISTSVDYYLSVGILPSPSCLPEYVRSDLPLGLNMVLEIELPWSASYLGEDSRLSSQRKCSRLIYPPQSQPSLVHTPNSDTLHVSCGNQGQPNQPVDVVFTSMIERTQHRPVMNLNYFSLDSVSETVNSTKSSHASVNSRSTTSACHLDEPTMSVDEGELWSLLQLVAP